MSHAAVRAPEARVLAQGRGWRVSSVVCTLGPHDRPFEERHFAVSIAAVLEGTFQYRSAAGRALLYPGAFLLGNAGACFECGHEHGVGDRCLSFHFDADAFDEIAAGVTGSPGFRFATGMVPALPGLGAKLLRARALAGRVDCAAEEAAIELAEAVVRSATGRRGPDAAPSARDQRRLSEVLRHIERHSHEPLALDRLAALARMSKYHFLRTFRRALGVTPHQFVLQRRLHRAAAALCQGRPVATVAFDTGFGDLSTFHAHFRGTFGTTPALLRGAGG